MAERMINVQVAGMMRVDLARRDFLQDLFERSGDVEKIKRIEPIVGKSKKLRLACAEQRGSETRGFGAAVCSQLVVSPCANAVGKKSNMHLAAFRSMAGQRSTCAENPSSG